MLCQEYSRRYMNMNVEYIYELASLAAARELSGAKLA